MLARGRGASGVTVTRSVRLQPMAGEGTCAAHPAGGRTTQLTHCGDAIPREAAWTRVAMGQDTDRDAGPVLECWLAPPSAAVEDLVEQAWRVIVRKEAIRRMNGVTEAPRDQLSQPCVAAVDATVIRRDDPIGAVVDEHQ